MNDFKCVKCGFFYSSDTLMSSCPKCCAQNWRIGEQKHTSGIGVFVGCAIIIFVLAAIIFIRLEGLF